LAFTLKDANGKVLESERHLLSLRDMAQIDNLEKLADAGATSFKIEGRLKDVDYVKNITAAYSEALNEVVRRNPEKYRRASFGRCTYTFTPNIQKSFNRGFTTYFAEGRKQGLVSFDTPKAMGEPVGKVKEIRGHSFNISTTTSFANGDGLCYLTPTGLVGFRVNKVEGNRIFPLRMPESLKPGTMLFRNLDQAFTTLLAKPSSERKIDIIFRLYEENGKLTLTAKDEVGRTATVQSDCELQPAAKPQEENIRRQLSKLGGTIYQCKDIEIDTKAFIPSSVLANMRREIIEEIYNVQFTKYSSHPSPNAQHPTPTYPTPYLYNASNRKAKEFYKAQGIEACSLEGFEHSGSLSTEEGGGRGNFLLMQCRYCLRNEMGFCTKSGKRAPWKEPLTISISDGREFQLQFDCKNCQMNVIG
jgi:putative protease